VSNACTAAGIEFDSEEGAPAENELLEDLFKYLEANLIDFSTAAPLCTRKISDYPEASPLARYQALRQEYVTSLRHKAVKLEATSRQILALLDGKNSLQNLKTELLNLHAKGDLRIEIPQSESSTHFLEHTIDRLVHQVLELLAKQGFLRCKTVV
jgi:methyltransferase-like protein